MIIAVEGCCHGELDNIYASLKEAEEAGGFRVDALLCCGDFQAVRNRADLSTMACPDKYKSMQTFYKYYAGEATAPVLTIFIGGNHEASNHLWELPYGGWVAPNIYYLGYAGVVTLNGVRIGGLSGIYKSHDYLTGHHECPPFTKGSMRSMYHIREFEVLQMMQLRREMSVFLSHDWPDGIAFHGDLQALLRRKKFLRDEINARTLGSPPALQLLQHLQPSFWFSAHMHVLFPAVYRHQGGRDAASHGQSPVASDGRLGATVTMSSEQQPHATKAPLHESGIAPPLPLSNATTPSTRAEVKATRFLALDKCLPGRGFMQILTVDACDNSGLCYDAEWLAIIRKTEGMRSYTMQRGHQDPAKFVPPTQSEVDAVLKDLKGDLAIPHNFKATVKAHPENSSVGPHANPQTIAFCAALSLSNPCDASVDAHMQQQQQQRHPGPPPDAVFMNSGNTSSHAGERGGPIARVPPPTFRQPLLLPPPSLQEPGAVIPTHNPNEIALDDDDDDDDDDGDDDDDDGDDDGDDAPLGADAVVVIHGRDNSGSHSLGTVHLEPLLSQKRSSDEASPVETKKAHEG